MASEMNDKKDKSGQAEKLSDKAGNMGGQSKNSSGKAGNMSGENQDNTSPGRRKMLKALAGLPVLGLLGVQVLRKTNYDNKHSLQRQIVDELEIGRAHV